jgi:hypothetical protein
MARSNTNRWWTIVLLLFLGVAGLFAAPSLGRADGVRVAVEDPGPQNPGGGPTSTGDPDSPSNTGKSQRQLRGGAERGRAPDLGGARTNGAVWAVRLRVAMQILRMYYLRF